MRDYVIDLVMVCVVFSTILIFTNHPIAYADTYSFVINVDGYDGMSNITVYILASDASILYRGIFNSTPIEFSANVTDAKVLILVYKAVPYVYQIEQLTQTNVINITLYDVVYDDSSIIIKSRHLFIERGFGTLTIYESTVFQNVGDKIIMNGTRLKVYLPPNYINLNSSIMSCCLDQTSWGFTLTLMVDLFPNQEYPVTYSYEIPISGKEELLSVVEPYKTSLLMIAIEDGLNVGEVSGMEFWGTTQQENKNFNIYRAVDIPSENAVSILLTNLGGPTVDLPLIIVLISSIMIVGLGIARYYRRYKSHNLAHREDLI